MTGSKSNWRKNVTSADELLKWKDPDQGKITIEDDCVILNFDYPYEIELSRIQSEIDLLHWTWHLCEKGWMNTHRIRLFMRAVAKYRGWNLWGLR